MIEIYVEIMLQSVKIPSIYKENEEEEFCNLAFYVH